MDDERHDDPLAAAVCSCWADERAPDALRQRVAELIAGDRATRGRWGVARYGSFGLAAAAVVAVVVGGALLRLERPPAGASVAAASVLPVVLQSELVRTHDHCSRGPADHQHLPVPRSNGYAIAASLRSQLDRPVLVGRPADAGWQFAGASVCAVGDVRSAHLMFRRTDGDALSLFSLPRSAAPTAADGQQFQVESDRHPIVGFVKHRAVYCLVGSGCAADVSVVRLADIRRQLEQQVVVADASPPTAVPGDELMYGTGR
jgi:hypothetical protein